MLAKRFAEILVLLSIVTSLSTKALSQNTQDCRTKKDIPLISGHWNNQDTHKDEDISFTRLDKPYYPTSQFDIVEAGANAKIYEQPSTDSKVSSTPEPGTRLMIYATETDEKGNATWYLVTDLRYSLGRENYGWIRLGQVKCKSSNKTISQGQQLSPAGSTTLVR